MGTKLNFLLLEFALGALWRRKTQSMGTLAVFSALVFLLSSVLFISDGIKKELDASLHSLPQITLQRIRAGKQSDIDVRLAEEILAIEGVKSAIPRVWGYYYFKPAGVNFTVMGVEAFSEPYTQELQHVVDNLDVKALEKSDGMVVGAGVKEILSENYYTDFFNFVTATGEWKRQHIAGVFESSVRLLSNDMILLPQKSAYEIFGMDKNKATDIVVSVSNPKEVATIAQKITQRYPDIRAISTEDLRVSYQNIFDYKSGFFLSLFVVSVFTFFMILFERTSGLSSEEKREVGILKALGWGMDEIIAQKFYEGLVICLSAFIIGLLLSLGYVYGLQAPLLREIFMGYSTLKPPFILPFSVDVGTIVLLFFLSVPIYLAAIIIPAWKASTLDADEVMR